METVLISACLVGDKCRYDGKGKYNPLVKEIMEKYDLLPVCPETLGGLKTPRDPSEIKGNEVITSKGKNVTKAYKEGALKAYIPCNYMHVKKAILQENSPSCGVHFIHDGSFNDKLIEGKGITTLKLEEKGIKCYTIEEFYDLFIKNEK